MDRNKEEILGSIQHLTSRRKQQFGDLKGQQEALKVIDDELPAKQELVECLNNMNIIRERLKEHRKSSESWCKQKEVVNEALATLSTTDTSLSDTLIEYMVVTKSKSVHAVPEDPESVDRKIITTAHVGSKVPANLSLFDDDLLDTPPDSETNTAEDMPADTE